MPLSEWWDHLYRHATGALGWSDHAVMTTPIPRIWLALQGLRYFHGGGPKKQAGQGIQDPKAQEAVLRNWAQSHNATLARKDRPDGSERK